MTNNKIGDLDLYDLLGIDINAEVAEIKKAYRKKALECHPDKNPDNPKAAELFHELSKALEILVDSSARAAYDKVLRARQAAKLRYKEVDQKRQKLIDDLERREREAELKYKKNKTYDERTDEEKLLAEISRLEKEGSKLLHEEQERMAQQVLLDLQKVPVDTTQYRIKIKWDVTKSNESNSCYDEETLRQVLKKYGDIKELMVSASKKGSALVEFYSKEAAEMAVDFEKGLPEIPLTLKWLKGSGIPSNVSKPRSNPTLVSERDYESLVLSKLRQASERQKLIEQMMKEDEE